MIYHAEWFPVGNGTWNYMLPYFDDYEAISLMEILKANPKLWISTQEIRC